MSEPIIGKRPEGHQYANAVDKIIGMDEDIVMVQVIVVKRSSTGYTSGQYKYTWNSRYPTDELDRASIEGKLR